MMGSREYFERCEAEERAAAERATDERARQSHVELARAYAKAIAAVDGGTSAPVDIGDNGGSTLPPDLRII